MRLTIKLKEKNKRYLFDEVIELAPMYEVSPTLLPDGLILSGKEQDLLALMINFSDQDFLNCDDN